MEGSATTGTDRGRRRGLGVDMGPATSEWTLNLLGGWQLFRGPEAIRVTRRQQRLIAALALLPSRPRVVLASTLWPESREAQAAGNLRAAIWRTEHEMPGLLASVCDQPRLGSRVSVDVALMHERLALIIDNDGGEVESLPLLHSAELLPGWYDDWVLWEQDRLRELRLCALDAVGRRLMVHGEVGHSVDAAMIAIRLDPLSESAHRLLVEAHLALGNRAAAVRVYRQFSSALKRELDIEPSVSFTDLIRSP